MTQVHIGDDVLEAVKRMGGPFPVAPAPQEPYHTYNGIRVRPDGFMGYTVTCGDVVKASDISGLPAGAYAYSVTLADTKK